MVPLEALPQSKHEKNIRQSPAEGHLMDTQPDLLHKPRSQKQRGSGACRSQRRRAHMMTDVTWGPGWEMRKPGEVGHEPKETRQHGIISHDTRVVRCPAPPSRPSLNPSLL